MTFHQMSIPPEEAQFLETRKFQIDEIARIFRVPPHMVGDLEKSSFSNIEQQSLEFVKYTLDPWVIRWEQAMHQALLLPDEKPALFFKFNVDGLLRGDYQSRMNGYAVGRQNGWLSANDIRELENMNHISAEEGGDLYLINGNMTKLKDAGIFANNLMMQFQSDLLGVPVERPKVVETTALGACYLAGLAVGFWNNKEELANNWQIDRRFEADMDEDTRRELYVGWLKAVRRTMNWL